MTVHIVVAIHDNALDAFMRPFYVPTTGSAIRSFGDEINRVHAENPMYQHSEDYNLYQLGTFNDETGKHENLQEPKQIAIGKQLKITQ